LASRLSPSTPLGKSVSLGATDTLKLVLTTLDGSTAKRPHQAFLTLTEPTTGLEESFVFNVKDSGKGKVDLVCHISQWLPAPLTHPVSQRPTPPILDIREANPRIDRHWIIRFLRAIQEQSVRPRRHPRPQRPSQRPRAARPLRRRV